MENLKEQINVAKLPNHIAVIMDGNGRWAKRRSQPRVFGHKNGVKAVREITEASAELGVKYLTLYAFSTENWNRPSFEVSTLMRLLVDTIAKEVKTLNKNNIRLNAIGDLSRLPSRTRRALLEGIESTRHNTRMDLVLALNYSGRWDILNATKKIAQKVKNQEL
ncbi:MAG: polyprenyl diphosphate synthase, partial [Bacteroidota bacterium]